MNRRKYDAYKLPGLIISILTIVGILYGGAAWIVSVNTSAEACTSDISFVKEALRNISQFQNSESVRSAEVQVRIDNIYNILNKLQQEIDEQRRILIKILANGDSNSEDVH